MNPVVVEFINVPPEILDNGFISIAAFIFVGYIVTIGATEYGYPYVIVAPIPETPTLGVTEKLPATSVAFDIDEFDELVPIVGNGIFLFLRLLTCYMTIFKS